MTQTPFLQNEQVTPVQVGDNTDLYRQESANLEAQIEQNLEALIENANQQATTIDNISDKLVPFSQTLGKQLGEKRNQWLIEQDRAAVRAQDEAGIDVEGRTQYNYQRALIHQETGQVEKIADDIEQKTGNYQVAASLKGGAQQYFAFVYGLQQAANRFEKFFELSRSTLELEFTDENNNKYTRTYDTAQPGKEKADLRQWIKDVYIAQFVRNQDGGKVNEIAVDVHLGDHIRKFFEKEAAAEGQQLKELNEKARESDRRTLLGSDLQSGEPLFQNYLNRYAPSLGVKGATIQFKEDVQTLLANTPINANLVSNIGNEPILERSSNTWKPARDVFPGLFTELDEIANKASNEDTKLIEATNAADGDKYKQGVITQWNDQPTVMSQDDKKKIISGWQPQWGPFPAELNNLITRETGDEGRIAELQYKKRENIPIEQKEVNAIIDDAEREKWQSSVNDPYAISQEFKDNSEEFIIAEATAYTKENDALKGKTPKYVNIVQSANRLFPMYYREAIQKGAETPDQAYLQATEKVRDNIWNGQLDVRQKSDPSREHAINLTKAKNAWKDSPSIVLSQILPGTEDAFEQLKKVAETGVGEIPHMYYQLTRNQKNISALDLANAQLRSQGLKPLYEEDESPEKDFNEQPIENRRLLSWRPTQKRIARYNLVTEGINFNQAEYLLPGLVV